MNRPLRRKRMRRNNLAMKNSEKVLFVVALLACLGGGAAYFLLAPSSSAKAAARKPPRGAEVAAWTDKGAAEKPSETVWNAPSFDLAEGWNYDLFSSPEISWDSKQKKYFAKELPPPPEEVFGLTLKSLQNPEFRLRISSYVAGTKPVPESVRDEKGQAVSGRYAAVLSFALAGGKSMVPLSFNAFPSVLTDAVDETGARVVTLTPESPVTIPKSSAKLKSFSISQGKSASGAFRETLRAVVIDESGKLPREFVIETRPVRDENRIEAVFSDGFGEWLYSETRVSKDKPPVREIFRRDSPDEPFKFVGSGREIRIGSDVFRIKELDISAQDARIEKQSSELDKKTKAPKTTERVLVPER